MDIKLARFHREAQRRIAETFPLPRLQFFQSLRIESAFSAFQKIQQILRDEERAWHLFLLALHVLYEGWHDLPPISATERKSLSRSAQSLRAVAGQLRRRGLEIEFDSELATLEKMADQLEWIVCPAADGIYDSTSSRGRRFDPRDAIPIFELGNLFRQRLAKGPIYPVIADLMNTPRSRLKKYSVQTIKITLAHMESAGFQPRVQFIYKTQGVVTLKFRNTHAKSDTNS